MKPLTFEYILAFLKANISICILLVFDIVLGFSTILLGNYKSEIGTQIADVQAKVKRIEGQIKNLTGIQSDINKLSQIEEKIYKKCVNFGKKTALYKFSGKINSFLNEGRNGISETWTNTYNLTKKQSISLDQDMRSFQNDYVVSNYSISFKSTFEQLIDFLKNVLTYDRLMQLKTLDVKNINSTKGEEENLLNVNITYSILGKIKLKEEDDHA